MTTMRQNPSKKLCRRRRGATTVEFALVAPIIFLLFLGAIEITRLNFIRHTAANAAYEAARQAIIPGGTAANAEDRAIELLTSVGVGMGVTVDIQEFHDCVTASVTVPVNLNAWGVLRFSNGMNVQQSCTLSRETPG